ncbi:hypothetical protein N7478_003913 [Penicillium angulare]|uniref:uncharacterized protein n=1 Tax=Penicillium angulare TaxID=116970 RepID=UPI00253FCC86|nr:uncharacterized protein N7478_003913 [Penicillium angulare]KAJ5288227.1 hypothetical protein N7478_003913 [Penicillium angulare]
MSLSVVGGLGAILSIFFEIYGAEGVSPDKVVWLSNYLILPLGLIFGRRSGTILSIVVNFVATIACAVSQNFQQHFGLRILQGLATGATESFINGQVVITDQFGVTRVITGDEAQEYIRALEADGEEIPDEARPKHTYFQMLKPWQKPVGSSIQTILKTWFHMFEAFTSPGILYATLLASVVLGCSIGMSLTYDTVIQSYGWPAKNVGLINLGGVFGGFGGMLYAGLFGDWFIIQMAKRSGGVHVPEHRLILLIFPGILMIVSLLLYGFTAGGSSTWGGPFMGWTILQVAFVSVLILSTLRHQEKTPWFVKPINLNFQRNLPRHIAKTE